MSRATSLRRLLCAATLAAAACAGESPSAGGCEVGAERCACTTGGGCDPGLTCLSDLCVRPAGPTDGADGGRGRGRDGGARPDPRLDGGRGPDPADCVPGGCRKIDLLFALDGSLSMGEEMAALTATDAFSRVVDALAEINCGDIDYRIGLTGDNDNGWRVPSGWSGAARWFDSAAMTRDEIVAAFGPAARALLGRTGTPTGCEHVLSSAVALLESDPTGFLRPDALLVLTLVSDVDDYGAYDQAGGNACGLGCGTPGAEVADLHARLLALKGEDATALAAIVLAGDPAVAGGSSLCGQPGSCGCNGIDCRVFHAERLWAFAGRLADGNGYTGDLCAGAAAVPGYMADAFAGDIDLACRHYTIE